MTILPSPAHFLPDGVLQLIRGQAAVAEGRRDLSPAVMDLVYKEGWFRLLTPRRWGGRALPLPQLVRLEEGLAFADGSLGWVVTLCSGAGWFGGFLPDGRGDLFMNRQLCIAGSGSATGEAQMVDGGYRISGDWAYASGIRHATAYTANCRVTPTNDESGDVRAFLFLPGEVQIRDDWNAMGLIASGSHGFSVKDRFLPADRAFAIDPLAATDSDPLYQYPFMQLAEATLAANISGMGQHFLDCCREYFGRRPMPEAEQLLAEAKAELDQLRGEFYRALDNSWAGSAGEELTRACHALAAKNREWSDRLYPFAGLGAARIDTEINRVWRDLHTAGQHPLLV